MHKHSVDFPGGSVIQTLPAHAGGPDPIVWLGGFQLDGAAVEPCGILSGGFLFTVLAFNLFISV